MLWRRDLASRGGGGDFPLRPRRSVRGLEKRRATRGKLFLKDGKKFEKQQELGENTFPEIPEELPKTLDGL